MTQTTKPYYLRGNFAPVTDELTAYDLPVTGALPAELNGTYVRNGPNPWTGASPDWRLGDGMLHGVHLSNGRASWYRNRYLRTGALAATTSPVVPDEATRRVGRLRGGGRSNTHVVAHGGRILSLVESAWPMIVDAELSTLGSFNFDGAVDTPVTAHPKICPLTGELHFFGYQHAPPHLTYYVAGEDGRVTRRQAIEVSGPSFLHDFALTRHHAVFFDTPLRMVADWGAGPAMPFQWSRTHQSRVVVVPRAGGPTRSFDIEPGFFGHTANAYEREGRLMVDGIRYVPSPHGEPPPHFHRWEIDLVSGRTREETLDDRLLEFPRVDERRIGLPSRYTYLIEVLTKEGEPTGAALHRHDGASGVSQASGLRPSEMAGECVMVPAGADAAEDEGWLLMISYDRDRDGSDLVVLDARAFDQAPVARIQLPRRVPYGFHGSWIPSVGSPAPVIDG
jgi:carotenoid cleavage dioxygenase